MTRPWAQKPGVDPVTLLPEYSVDDIRNPRQGAHDVLTDELLYNTALVKLRKKDKTLRLGRCDHNVDMNALLWLAVTAGYNTVIVVSFQPRTLHGGDEDFSWHVDFADDRPIWRLTKPNGNIFNVDRWLYDGLYRSPKVSVTFAGRTREFEIRRCSASNLQTSYRILYTGNHRDHPDSTPLAKAEPDKGLFVYTMYTNKKGTAMIEIAQKRTAYDKIVIPLLHWQELVSRCAATKANQIGASTAAYVLEPILGVSEGKRLGALVAFWALDGYLFCPSMGNVKVLPRLYNAIVEGSYHPTLEVAKPLEESKPPDESIPNQEVDTPEGPTAAKAVELDRTHVPKDFGPPTMTVAGPPALCEGYSCAPDASRDSDEVCVVKRITDFKNEVEPPDVYKKYKYEFVSMLPKDLVELSVDEVNQAMSKPNQRADFERNQHMFFLDYPDKFWSYFQKAEAASGYAPPRGIANPSVFFKVFYSRFTLPLAQALKAVCVWYAFGLSPEAVAARVHIICARARKNLLPTDFSKWDAHQSEFLAGVKKAVFHRAFPTKKGQIDRAFKTMYDTDMRTKFGVKSGKGWVQRSGSPDTSIGNTVVNAFVAFCAFRNKGYAPTKAYSSLGIYGGDDGLNADMPYDTFAQTCVDLGLKFTGQSLDVSSDVTFLSRIFVNPRHDVGSIPDPLRALGSLHLVRKQRPPDEALANKIDGYLTVDHDVPFFSAYLRLYRDTYAKNIGPMIDFDSYWAQRACEGPFPAVQDEELARAAVATSLGVTSAEVLAMEDQVAKGEFPDQLRRETQIKSPVAYTEDRILAQ